MMKSIGILISDISVRAGTERAVVSLSNMLVKYGDYEVTIYSLYSCNGDRPSFTVEKKVKIRNLEMSRGNRLVKFANYLQLLKLLNRECSMGNIDCILGSVTAYNILISFLKNCMKVGCEHINYNTCTFGMKVFRRIRYRKLDRIVVLTKEDREKYYFIPPQKIKIIPNPLTMERGIKSELTEKTIISVGRLDYQKGYDLLVNMASEIKKRLPDWQIVIYGEGNMRVELEKLIVEKKLENYVFLPGQTVDVKEKLLKSSIYVMTSRAEGMGIVLTEAQACGLPIVAFDCESGPREVIDDEVDGYLVKNFNQEVFIGLVISLAMNIDLRRKLGNSGYISCKKYEEAIVYDKWNAMFSMV